MLTLLTLTLLALADEPGIVPLAAGATYKAPVDSMVLPRPYYDTCLADALSVEQLQEDVERCGRGVAEARVEIDFAHQELDATQHQADLLIADNGQLRLQLAAKTERLQIVRRQRNTALAVAGGSILIMVGAGGLALAL